MSPAEASAATLTVICGAAQAAANVDAARDLNTCLAIWNATPHDIPHQTRRTEEDQ